MERPGFYLATHVAEPLTAYVRQPGGLLQYQLSGGAVTQLRAAGARTGPIAPGAKGVPIFEGHEFIVPSSAFDVFNSLRQAGEIIVTAYR
jgi:hypothetical protein